MRSLPAQPVIGRDRERRLLECLVDDLARGRRPRPVVLVGEAGIGKSALASYAVAAAERAEVPVGTGRGIPLAVEQPFLALVTLLRDLGAPPPPRMGPEWSAITSSLADPVTVLLNQVLDEIERATTRPTLLVVEDLHWLDAASLTAVHHLGAGLVNAPIALLVTSRPPAPGSNSHRVIADLSGSVITLAGLSRSETRALAVSRLGHEPDEHVTAALDAAGGNPMLAHATLDRTGSGHADPAIDPIAAVVGALDADSLEALQAAAVGGDQFDLNLLAELLGSDERIAHFRIQPAVRSGVVIPDADGYAFRHHLYRDAVLATLSEPTRAHLHRRQAQVLERHGYPVGDVIDHLARGARVGADRATVDKLADAAASLVLGSPATALQISDVAIAVLGAEPLPVPLQVTRAAALAGCGRYDEAVALGDRLIAGGLAPEVEAQVSRGLAIAAYLSGDTASAHRRLQRIVELSADPVSAARAETEIAWAELLAVDVSSAVPRARRSLECGDLGTRISAHSLLCWAGLWTLDHADAASSAAAVVEAVASAAPGGWHVFQPLLAAGAVHFELGEVAAAAAIAERGRMLTISAGASWAAPAYDALLMACALAAGRLSEARYLGERGVAGTAVIDAFGAEVWCRAQLARLALVEGRLDDAREQVEHAGLAVSEGRAQLGIDILHVAEAGVLLARGREDERLVLLEEAWALQEALGIGQARGKVATEYVAALLACGDRPRAMAVAKVAAGDSVEPFVRPVAEAARIRMLIEPTPVTAGLAVEAAARSGDALLLLDTLQLAAEIDPQFRSRADAQTLSLGVTPPQPDLPGASAGPLAALTAAELLIARRVAAGESNPQIAERTGVSRRTVDSQVLSCYRKLGINTRVALTRLMMDDDVP